MIELFHICTKEKNFSRFFKKHGLTTSRIEEYLIYVHNADKDCYFITHNMGLFFAFLKRIDSQHPLETIRCCTYLENNQPKLIADMKSAISNNSWDTFYNKYRPLADFIIDQSRRERVLNLCIEHGNKCFENFGQRDSWIRGDPYLSKYSGEMIKYKMPCNHSRQQKISGANTIHHSTASKTSSSETNDNVGSHSSTLSTNSSN